MPASSSSRLESDLDLWRAERTPTWRVLLPLVLVVAALAALAVVPHLITRRNEALRRELTEVLVPLAVLNADLERSIAAEAAAVRGFALTRDPAFADRYLAVHGYAGRVAREVDSMAAGVGGEVARAAEAFRRERASWEAANIGFTPSGFREHLREHQRQFEAVTAAAQRFDDVLRRAAEERRGRIEEAYRLRTRITLALALLALLAGGAALWLAYRLWRSSASLLRRGRDEAALRRIAQAMAEAEDLPSALQLIAQAVVETTRADGAHVEQVVADRGEVEVVAATGKGAPAVGVRTPYAGSVAQQAIVGGEGVRRTPQAAAAGRAAAGPLATGGPGHLLVVPLLSEGEAEGAIVLHRAQRPFEDHEVQRARLLADMAALVLQRLRDFDAVRRKERALQETAAELRALTETLERRVEERTRQVRELSRALTLAEQEERRRIAQVLHDDLQQILVAAKIQSLLGGGERLEATLDEAIRHTRSLSHELSPPLLQGEDLDDLLRWVAAQAEKRYGLEVTVEVGACVRVPDPALRVLLYQVVRELLLNVVKHAGTDRVWIVAERSDGHVRLVVEDEGAGFDPAEVEGAAGLGLPSVRERVELVGGQLEVASGPGEGTRVTITVPTGLR